ncbi:MAG TPA: HAD-IA family hydrolase [Nocardioides sp.]|uniref:HAD-IA family hydrolase n=1 Tax=Nocardioides sp. TaxID=35761 RepID=UPI002CC4E917|nr:HAD-IA family hydrolase [Nocardioides sp.]HQR28151.1 HAD-IA family hydrolase [Nocardioides sp.]
MAGVQRRQGLLLDVGVVLLKSAWEIADEFERLHGLAPRTIPGRGPFDPGGDPLWERHLAGELTERDYWLGNAEEAVRRGAPLDGHPHLMRAMFQSPGIDPARPAAVDLLRQARATGVTTAVFSNELMDFQGREWVEAQAWFPLFDVVFDATERGVRKPTPAAYDAVVADVNLPAGSLVFVDDNPRYAQAGADAGMQAVLLDVLDPDAAFAEAARLLGI